MCRKVAFYPLCVSTCQIPAALPLKWKATTAWMAGGVLENLLHVVAAALLSYGHLLPKECNFYDLIVLKTFVG